jgi:hypothetical protein
MFEELIQPKGRVIFWVHNPDGTLALEQVRDNVVCTVGKTALAAAMTSNSSSKVSYAALGTNAAAPAAGDVKLGTEAYRNAIASMTNVANVATMTGFFSATETSGHYFEAGLFIGGTGAADSGTILSHVACDINKTTSQTLTLSWSITLT